MPVLQGVPNYEALASCVDGFGRLACLMLTVNHSEVKRLIIACGGPVDPQETNLCRSPGDQSMWYGRFMWAFLTLCLAGGVSLWAGQTGKQAIPARITEADDKNKADAEEEKDRAVMERFRRVLENNPRRGTALDRIYGYHVERGTLDQLVGDYTGRTRKNPKDGASWMIVGLLESQRGRDAAAIAAFKQAEANLPDNAMPAYYQGQSLILVG